MDYCTDSPGSALIENTCRHDHVPDPAVSGPVPGLECCLTFLQDLRDHFPDLLRYICNPPILQVIPCKLFAGIAQLVACLVITFNRKAGFRVDNQHHVRREIKKHLVQFHAPAHMFIIVFCFGDLSDLTLHADEPSIVRPWAEGCPYTVRLPARIDHPELKRYGQTLFYIGKLACDSRDIFRTDQSGKVPADQVFWFMAELAYTRIYISDYSLFIEGKDDIREAFHEGPEILF